MINYYQIRHLEIKGLKWIFVLLIQFSSFIDEGVAFWLGHTTFPSFPGDLEKGYFQHPSQCSLHCYHSKLFDLKERFPRERIAYTYTPYLLNWKFFSSAVGLLTECHVLGPKTLSEQDFADHIL